MKSPGVERVAFLGLGIMGSRAESAASGARLSLGEGAERLYSEADAEGCSDEDFAAVIGAAERAAGLG